MSKGLLIDVNPRTGSGSGAWSVSKFLNNHSFLLTVLLVICGIFLIMFHRPSRNSNAMPNVSTNITRSKYQRYPSEGARIPRQGRVYDGKIERHVTPNHKDDDSEDQSYQNKGRKRRTLAPRPFLNLNHQEATETDGRVPANNLDVSGAAARDADQLEERRLANIAGKPFRRNRIEDTDTDDATLPKRILTRSGVSIRKKSRKSQMEMRSEDGGADGEDEGGDITNRASGASLTSRTKYDPDAIMKVEVTSEILSGSLLRNDVNENLPGGSTTGKASNKDTETSLGKNVNALLLPKRNSSFPIGMPLSPSTKTPKEKIILSSILKSSSSAINVDPLPHTRFVFLPQTLQRSSVSSNGKLPNNSPNDGASLSTDETSSITLGYTQSAKQDLSSSSPNRTSTSDLRAEFGNLLKVSNGSSAYDTASSIKDSDAAQQSDDASTQGDDVKSPHSNTPFSDKNLMWSNEIVEPLTDKRDESLRDQLHKTNRRSESSAEIWSGEAIGNNLDRGSQGQVETEDETRENSEPSLKRAGFRSSKAETPTEDEFQEQPEEVEAYQGKNNQEPIQAAKIRSDASAVSQDIKSGLDNNGYQAAPEKQEVLQEDEDPNVLRPEDEKYDGSRQDEENFDAIRQDQDHSNGIRQE